MIPSVDITPWLEVKSSMEEDSYQWKKWSLYFCPIGKIF